MSWELMVEIYVLTILNAHRIDCDDIKFTDQVNKAICIDKYWNGGNLLRTNKDVQWILNIPNNNVHTSHFLLSELQTHIIYARWIQLGWGCVQ